MGGKAALLAAAFVFSCSSAISSLIETWSANDVFSYGFLVPMITLVWIWHEKGRVKRLPVKPALFGGMSMVAAGGLLLVLGEVSGTAIVQELAIIVIIPGLVLTLFGRRILLALSLPLAYLVLMIPFLDGLVDKLHWPFQLFAAATAEKMLVVAHIPVVRIDQYLQLPNINLEVANACSGVRFLISTMVLCVPLAFITQKSPVQRALLFLFALLISVLANPVRVSFVAAWAYYGNGDIHGPLHILQGYVVYMIGMAALFGGAWLLHRLPLSNQEPYREPERTGPEGERNPGQFNRAWFVSVMVLLAFGAYSHVFKAQPVELKTSLHDLPAVIGEWTDTGLISNARSFSVPDADAELARLYRNGSGREVRLQIAYFESQDRRKKLVYYKLQTLHERSEELPLPDDSRPAVRINKAIISDGIQDMAILSWYDIGGRIVAGRYMARLITAFNGMFHRRTNGALIIVSSPVPPGGREETVRDEVSFVQSLLPVLDTFIP